MLAASKPTGMHDMASAFDRAVKATTLVGDVAPYARSAYDIATGGDSLNLRGDETNKNWGSSNFLGGYTANEMIGMMANFRLHRPANKNLFIISIANPAAPITAAEMGLKQTPVELRDANGSAWGIPEAFSMFATDVSYGRFTLTGEKKQIGSGYADTLNSSGPVDVHVTTMDDQRGTLKRWFKALCRPHGAQRRHRGCVGGLRHHHDDQACLRIAERSRLR